MKRCAGGLNEIDPSRLYKTSDKELRFIAAAQTMARWRCEKKGPPYVKAGNLIYYRGRDILEWLDRHVVDHEASEDGA